MNLAIVRIKYKVLYGNGSFHVLALLSTLKDFKLIVTFTAIPQLEDGITLLSCWTLFDAVRWILFNAD